MNYPHKFDDFKDFIEDVRSFITKQDGNGHNLFDTYANEARFGLSVIKDDLSKLDYGAEIMEIGAGILLLSGFLAKKGFRVNAVEPIGKGFSIFFTLQSAVLKYYEKIAVTLNVIDSEIESLVDREKFDYVFSINVFEHIGNIELGLANSYLSLRLGGSLRIYCPNYLFPYEPHFNIPTLINKRLTAFVFKSRILSSDFILEGKEVWDGLNWINTLQVRKFFRQSFGIAPVFNRLATYLIVKRTLDDQHFRQRRSGWISACVKTINQWRLINLFKFVPEFFSPVMDFSIQRKPFNCDNAKIFT